MAIFAIVYGKVDVAGWFKPTPPVGRYQVVSGRAHNAIFSTAEVPAIIKIDTATGKSWVFFPIEAGDYGTIPNRWVEVSEPDPSPSPSPKKQP